MRVLPTYRFRACLAGAALLTLALAVPAHSAPPTTCGPINVSETWDISGSPYVLTCDVVVMPGAVLTIDPGVQVQLKPNVRLRVQGGIISALGVAGSEIIFISNDPTNRGVGVEIAPSSATSAIFDYCIFKTLQAGISLLCCATSAPAPVIVTNSNFIGNFTGVTGYSGSTATFFGCSFDGGGSGVGVDTADKQMTACTFVNLTAGAQCMERSSFSQCGFSSCTVGLDLCAGGYQHPVRDCFINGCGIGVRYPDVFERNNVSFNTTGMVVNSNAQLIQCNDIYSNSLYNAQMVTNVTLSIPNNWWGTTSGPAIDARILDGLDPPPSGLGVLMYTPVLPANFASTGCLCVNASISAQPVSATKYGSQNVSFSVTAAGTPPLSYQWYRNNVPVVNNGRFSGASTATLSITPIAYNGGDFGWTDAGSYHCRVSNFCNTLNSLPAYLTVNNCFADINHNGAVSVQDLFTFLAAWFAGCP